MPHQKSLHCTGPISTSTSSLIWRTQIKQHQLVSQISSILLQRKNWIPILKPFNLSCKLTPSLFLQILSKTQRNPQISLNFFNWAKSNLKFQPDLKTQCQIIKISIGNGLFKPAKSILDSLIQTHTPLIVAESLIHACRGCESQSSILSFVLERYSIKCLCVEGIEVFAKMRVQGCAPSTRACNALLEALQRKNETRLAWCYFGAVMKDGVLADKVTWSLVAQILSKNGKFETIVKMLDSGLYNSAAYSIGIDWYGKIGDFGAAFARLNEMFDRKLVPGFSSYSSILDGACRHKNIEVINRIMRIMVENELLQNSVSFEYDFIIQNLSDLEKTYAAEMFVNKAFEEKVELKAATYGCLLRALSKEGRIKEAVELYQIVLEKGITVNSSSYSAYADALCIEKHFERQTELLKDVIERGFSPCPTKLSNFITSLCNKHRWRDAEQLLNMILTKESLPDSSCCCSLVKHYCKTRQIAKAMALHNELEKGKGSLDVNTYNLLIDLLFKGKKIEEAKRVFDYMRMQNQVTSASFTIMIRGLCNAKELRTAMKIHDEMLKMKLKPDKATYKRLITGFN